MRTPIQIRQATVDDTAGMKELTRRVWEGGDYLPYVWTKWLADTKGHLFAALSGDRLVGLQHVSRQADGTAWVEGIRVAADLQGQGLGRALLEHGLGWSAEVGCWVARLATYSGNPASNHIAVGAGMHLAATFHRWSAAARWTGPPIDTVRVALPHETEEITAFLTAHPVHMSNGLYTDGWTAYGITESALRRLLALHSVVVVGEETAIEAVGIACSGRDRPGIRPGLVDGSSRGVRDLGGWLRGRAQQTGLELLRGLMAPDDDARQGLRDAGFEEDPDGLMHVYEVDLSNQSGRVDTQS